MQPQRRFAGILFENEEFAFCLELALLFRFLIYAPDASDSVTLYVKVPFSLSKASA